MLKLKPFGAALICAQIIYADFHFRVGFIVVIVSQCATVSLDVSPNQNHSSKSSLCLGAFDTMGHRSNHLGLWQKQNQTEFCQIKSTHQFCLISV